MNKVLFYPVLSFGAIALYFTTVNPASVSEIAARVAEISLLAMLLIHFFERWFPYRLDWNLSQGDRSANFFMTVIFLPLITKGVELMLTFGIAVFSTNHHQRVLQWPSHLPLFVQLIFGIILCEFFFYWIHRFGHRSRVLWKFHSIHHSVKRVYWDNSGRFHPLDLVLNLSFYLLPLILLGAPPMIYGAFLVLNAVTGMLEHANVAFEAGPLNYVFNTAQLHRWHHSVDPVVSSRNFGKTLCIWDLVFRTWHLDPAKDVQEVGVETESIPDDLMGQWLYPFRK